MLKTIAVFLLSSVCVLAQQQPPPGAQIVDQALRLARNNQFDAAVRLLKSEIEKDPRNIVLRGGLAGVYGEKQQYTNAIAEIREVLRINPKSAAVLAALGRLQFLNGDETAAQESIRQSIEAAGTNLGILVLSSTVSADRGEFGVAELIDEELYRAHPDSAPIANNLAYVLAQQNKDLDRAFELAQFAYSKLPNASPIIDTLGWVHFMRGNLERALPLLCRALSMQVESQPYQRHVLKALDEMDRLNPRQLELRDWLRADEDPEREAHLLSLATELAN